MSALLEVDGLVKHFPVRGGVLNRVVGQVHALNGVLGMLQLLETTHQDDEQREYTDAALECVKSFTKPACVIVKHANPCGVAIGADILQAYDLAFATDPTSAFGGIIAFNRELDAATAKAIVDRQFGSFHPASQVAVHPDRDRLAGVCFQLRVSNQKPTIIIPNAVSVISALDKSPMAFSYCAKPKKRP